MKKYRPVLFIINLLLVLVVATLIISLKREQAIELTTEPFLCNGQPCNVILIIPETLSARHMGIYGYQRDAKSFILETAN